jgi:hypothetical protein
LLQARLGFLHVVVVVVAVAVGGGGAEAEGGRELRLSNKMEGKKEKAEEEGSDK